MIMNNRGLTRRDATSLRVANELHNPAWALLTMFASLVAALLMASTVSFVVALGLSAAHGIIELPPIRRARGRRLALKLQRKRSELREHRLEEACVATCELDELSVLLGCAAEIDDSIVVQLEPLLERYVELALARKTCQRLLRDGDAPQLELQLAIARESHHPREAQVLECRIAHCRVTRARLEELDDSICELADVVRHCAERACLPAVEPPLERDTVEACLAQYDAVEAAELACA